MGPDMDDKTRIVTFDGNGFHNWKFRLDCLQREVKEVEELREVATDTEPVRAEKKVKLAERRK